MKTVIKKMLNPEQYFQELKGMLKDVVIVHKLVVIMGKVRIIGVVKQMLVLHGKVAVVVLMEKVLAVCLKVLEVEDILTC